MDYATFRKFLKNSCVYETIYTDSDGRQIMVIKVIDAFCMVNDAMKYDAKGEELNRKADEVWQRATGKK